MKKFVKYSIEELKELIRKLESKRIIKYIHIHHTGIPSKADYMGLRTIQSIWKYHTDPEPVGRGWSDIGYHFIIVPDGGIWFGRDLDIDPASIYGFNKGAIAIAVLGDFEKEKLEEPQKAIVVDLVNFLLEKFDLSYEQIIFHREKANTLCPGKNIDKEEFLIWLEKKKPEAKPVNIRPVEVIKEGKTYKGYILPDSKGYVEIRQLFEDMGYHVEWRNERIFIEPGPDSPEEKLDKILKIILKEG